MSRRLTAFALSTAGVAVASVAGNVHAAGPDMLIAPFECGRSGGQLTLTSSPLRGFEITGPHAVRRLAVCGIGRRLPGAVACTPVDLHRFEVACGKRRVPWAQLAAAIDPRAALRDHTAPPARLVCAVGAPAGTNATAPKFARPLACRAAAPGGRYVRLLMPPGFAPLAELGVRVAAGSNPPVRTAQPGGRTGLLHTLVTSSPLPDITPVVLSQPAELAVAASEPEDSVRPSRGAGLPLLLLTVLAGLATAGAAAWRWPSQARQARALAAGATLRLIELAERHGATLASRLQALAITSRVVGARPPSNVEAANAAAAVSAMLAETTARLASLRGAGPLVDVLQQELGQLRQRLGALTIAAAEGDEAASRASPGFRNLLRDIERVRRIADSAALSMGGRPNAARIPKTRSEAYDLLGLNPDAPEGTLKKVADGLRMSWHPDHARDEADRTEREARIKAINIAVELITNKRAA